MNLEKGILMKDHERAAQVKYYIEDVIINAIQEKEVHPITDAIFKLKDSKERVVIYLYWIAGHQLIDIAKDLGISKSMVSRIKISGQNNMMLHLNIPKQERNDISKRIAFLKRKEQGEDLVITRSKKAA